MGSRSGTPDSSFVGGQGDDTGVLFVDVFEHVEGLEADLCGWMTKV